jgi:hypothetical protein
MARPRSATPTRRYHVTVSAAVADRLDAHAFTLRRRSATVAADLLEEGIDRAVSKPADRKAGPEELVEARRHIEELNGRLATLRAELARRGRTVDPSSPSVIERGPPRWEWPLPALLSDDQWWDRWLPRLYELLGRQLMTYAPVPATVLDGRGYADLMGFLFPPVRRHGAAVSWRSQIYGELAALEDTAAFAADGAGGAVQAQVGEPVVRHVAEALCALEATGGPGADPYLRLRAKSEIVTAWADILRNLLGESAPPLPREQLA